ncbi:MAG: beta strand repeat-containing protein [Planctomycetaceae bacterium]
MSGRSVRLWVVILAAGAAASHPERSRAQITTFTTQAAFQAALVPGSVTNSFPDIPNFTAAGPARYVEGTPYASYNIYCPAALFADSGFSIGGQTVRAVGNYGYGSPVYLDFSSNNVRQFGASFFLCDLPGNLIPGDVTVQFFDGSSTSVPIVTGSVATNMGSTGGANFFGVSVANSGQAIRSLTIPRYPGTGVYVNIGPVTTTAFDDVARFWSGAGSATSLGGSGTWASAGSSWAVSSASIGAWDPTKRAVFSRSGGTVAVAAGGVSAARGIAFDASGYFLEGPGTVTLTGTSSAANDIYVGPGIAPSIATTVSAASGLAKTGPGILRVTGTVTGGPVTISRGVLQVGNGGTSGAITALGVVNNAELEFNRSDAASFAGAISGTGALYVTGGGRTTLTGTSSYTGATGILSSGTLAITNGAAVAGSVRVSTGTSGGVFDVSGVSSGYAVPGTQTLTGDGTVLGSASLGGGATLSPGVGRGTITMSGSLTFGGGGNYNWQGDDLALPAGQTGSYDLVSVLGSLSITASATSTFRINLWSVIPDGSSGPVAGFDPLVSSTYTLLTTTGGISGFGASKFTINTSATNGTAGFINDLQGGTFRVAQAGNDLQLVFAPAGSSITIDVASGVTRTQTAAGYPSLSGNVPVVKTGAGTLVLDQANPLTASTTVQSGTLLLANGAALSTSTLVPEAGGTITLAPGLQTAVGGLVANAGGLVDVGSGMITVAAGLSTTDMVAALLTGLGDGSWKGTSGIASSVAAASGGSRTVGWLDNGGGSVTFAFAAAGDTNLDWQVDVLDTANFLSSGKLDSGLPASWNEGDFTYDGFVDILDSAAFLSTGLLDAGPYNTAAPLGVTAVPEPGGWAGLSAAIAIAVCLRRTAHRDNRG